MPQRASWEDHGGKSLEPEWVRDDSSQPRGRQQLPPSPRSLEPAWTTTRDAPPSTARPPLVLPVIDPFEPAWAREPPPPTILPVANENLPQPSSSRHQKHVPLTCYDKCQGFLVYFGYISLNFVDFIFSGCMLVFAVYLSDQLGPVTALPLYVSWIVWTYAVVGSLILVEVFLSVSSLTFVNCRSASHVSQHMTYVLAAASFVTGVFAFLLQQVIFNYVTAHTYEFGISHHEMDAFKSYYKYTAAIALGGVPPLQGLRYCVSSTVSVTSDRLDGEFGSMLNEHDRLLEGQQLLTRESRQEKYSSLRVFYQDKYQPS